MESGAAASSGVTISYDAVSQSYVLAKGGQPRTFGPAELVGSDSGRTTYQLIDGSTAEQLTLDLSAPGGERDYVGIGAWQRSMPDEDDIVSDWDVFVYGLASPGSAVPVSGNARYGLSLLGYLSVPGEEVRSFTGNGALVIDFAGGQFYSHSYVSEDNLVTPGGGFGGSLVFETAGLLGSDAHFSGAFSYRNSDHVIVGPLGGHFFGPSAQELGAGFAGSNADGAAVAGAFAGVLQSGETPVSLRLDNIVATVELPEFYASHSGLFDSSLDPEYRGAVAANHTIGGTYENVVYVPTGKVTLHPDGRIDITLHNSGGYTATLTAADQVASSDPNFDAYIVDPTDGPEGLARIELYKPGAANSEVQLTYASFGVWRQTTENSPDTSQFNHDYFIYGFETPKYLIMARTGTASYHGVVHGMTTSEQGEFLDVGGTSVFNLNFGNQSYSGQLDLLLTSSSAALGTWTFSELLNSGQFQIARLYKEGVSGPSNLPYNSILPRFYGPKGEEIAATFTITDGWPAVVGSRPISGVTVAKED